MQTNEINKMMQSYLLQSIYSMNSTGSKDADTSSQFGQLLQMSILNNMNSTASSSTSSADSISSTDSSNQLDQMLQLYMLQNMGSMGSAESDDEDGGSVDTSNNLSQMLQMMLLSEISKQISSSTEVNNNTASFFESKDSTGTNSSNQVSDSILQKSTSTDIDSIIKSAAKKYGVDEEFIKAVIQNESSFNPNSVSNAGAIGLMQLMPDTAKSLGVANPFDPLDNINGGTLYLKRLMDAYGGSKELALAAYNGGIGRMNTRGVDTIEEISKMPKETVNYVKKVMDTYKKNTNY